MQETARQKNEKNAKFLSRVLDKVRGKIVISENLRFGTGYGAGMPVVRQRSLAKSLRLKGRGRLGKGREGKEEPVP
jgi:hypothetical protein